MYSKFLFVFPMYSQCKSAVTIKYTQHKILYGVALNIINIFRHFSTTGQHITGVTVFNMSNNIPQVQLWPSAQHPSVSGSPCSFPLTDLSLPKPHWWPGEE